MPPDLVASTSQWLEHAIFAKRAVPVILLALFWCWETWRPFFGHREGRWLHAARNVGIAVFNTAALGLIFGAITVIIVDWTTRNHYGLLHVVGLTSTIQFVLALVLLDGWMYFWHRANHVVPCCGDSTGCTIATGRWMSPRRLASTWENISERPCCDSG